LATSDVTVAGGGTCEDMIVLIMFGLNMKLNHHKAPTNKTARIPVMRKRNFMMGL
jgi:hypothetical protein